MATVEQILPDSAAAERSGVDVREEISSEKRDLEGASEPEMKPAETGAEPLTLFDDPEEEQAAPAVKEDTGITERLADPATIMKNGLNFITGLAKTFSDPEATKRLVSEVVAKDEKDGRTYLKIPVESEKTVEDFIGMVGSFIKSMG